MAESEIRVCKNCGSTRCGRLYLFRFTNKCRALAVSLLFKALVKVYEPEYYDGYLYGMGVIKDLMDSIRGAKETKWKE